MKLEIIRQEFSPSDVLVTNISDAVITLSAALFNKKSIKKEIRMIIKKRNKNDY